MRDVLRKAALLALSAVTVAMLSSASSFAGDLRSPSGRVVPADNVVVSVSGCLDGLGTITPLDAKAEALGDSRQGIVVTATASSIRLDHVSALLNCCSTKTVVVDRDGFTVRFNYRESGDFCFCLCPFDISAEMRNLGPGLYRVEVWDEGGCIHTAEVTVPPPASVLVSAASACKSMAEGPGEEAVEVELIGNDLHVLHRDAYLNCCLELAIDMEREPGLIRLREIDNGLPCDCLCPIDILIVVTDLEPGSYQVELYGVGGYLLAQRSIDVP
jgi:hypothetical protein